MSHVTSYFNNSYDQSKRKMLLFFKSEPIMTKIIIFRTERNYCKSEFQLHRTLHKNTKIHLSVSLLEYTLN